MRYLVLVVPVFICNREYPENAMINVILMHLELSRRGQEVVLQQGTIAAGSLFIVPPFHVARTTSKYLESIVARLFIATIVLLLRHDYSK